MPTSELQLVLEVVGGNADSLGQLADRPEAPREAMVLHYPVELAPTDAAKRLGISRAAFDTRLSRGREALRRELTLLTDQTKGQVEIYLEGISERVKACLHADTRERATAAVQVIAKRMVKEQAET